MHSYIVRETDRYLIGYLITSLNTTLHPIQVSTRGWGVSEGTGSVRNANQRLTQANREYPKHQEDKSLSEPEEEKCQV